MKRSLLIVLVLALGCIPGSALGAEQVTLPPVVVTATMTETPLDTAPGTIQVITRGEIESLGAETVADVLRFATAIVIVSGTGRSQEVSLRGLGPGHTLVLLDGRRITSGYNATLDVNQIPVTLVDQIEIVRGPGSALYGSEATGGVINIITRRPPRKTEGAVDLRGAAGQSAEQAVAAMAGGAAGPARANIAAAWAGKGRWDNDEALPDDIDDTVQTAVLSRVALDLGTAQTLMVGGEYNGFSRQGRRLYQSLERERDAEDRRWGGFVQYESHPATPFSGMLRVYGNKNESDIEFTPPADEADRSRDLMQVEARGSYDFSGVQLTAGGELRWQRIQGDELIIAAVDEQSERVEALFGQIDWQPLELLNLVASLRYDRYNTSGSQITPRLVTSLFIPHGRIWAAYGRGFRAPTLDELYSRVAKRQGRDIYYGNEDLESETSDSYEAGLELRSGRLWGRLVGFYNHLDNLIESRLVSTQGQNRIFAYDNVEKARTYGAEFEACLPLHRRVDLSLQATWIDTENEESGYDLAYEPPWKAGATLAWQVPGLGLTTEIRYRYYSESEDGQGNTLEGYDLVNLYLSKAVTRTLRLYAGVDNLLDESNDDFTQSPLQLYAGVALAF